MESTLFKTLASFVHQPDREPGQAFIEYALIVVGVGTATEVAIQSLGQRTADVFNAISASLGAS